MIRFKAKPILRQIRMKLCTQDEMVNLLKMQQYEMPRSTYANKERGHYTVSVEEALIISRILNNAEIYDLFEEVSDDAEKAEK